jgi:putative endonuclease
VPYYVYIVLCEGDRLYTGYTRNLASRLRLHKKGKAARYTKMHRPVRLLHFEEFDSRAEAMRREKRIKKLTHREKLRLARFKTKRCKDRRKDKKTNQKGVPKTI